MTWLIPAGAVLLVLVGLRVFQVAWADRKRAKAEARLRSAQVRNLALMAALGVALVGVATFGGCDGPPSFPASASASPGRSDGPSCSDRNTGVLTLVRNTPTTITWTYTPRTEAAGETARLYVRVDDRDTGQGSVRTTSGTLADVPARPVAVHLEGRGPGGRVYATCTA
ncbi:hypothetical protein R8Z50_30255 [Longispora sp. K20-0274]|uniref:hypothetical protein n=1 Tax=Longispora sp. K20-0274 TaxID=3088255 RepID=UPI00399AFF12